MADKQNQTQPEKNDDRIRKELRRDPEFEMPDPEQVKRDIDQAEKTYGDGREKKTA